MTLKRSRTRLTIAPLILLAATSCVPVRTAGLRAPAPVVQEFLPPPLIEAASSTPAAAAAAAPNPLAKAPAVRAALPFEDDGASDADQARSLRCLASAVYYEAGSEPVDGQRAVAQVVLNRVRHPAFPNSVCGVVYQGSWRSTGCQFTFTCDGSLRRRPDRAGWAQAEAVASEALAGRVYAPVGQATHYHTRAVLPYWSHSLTRATTIGAHIFYRWRGANGEPSAFNQAYAGIEPFAGATRASAPVRAAKPGAATIWRGEGDSVTIHRAEATRPRREASEQNGVRVHRGVPPTAIVG